MIPNVLTIAGSDPSGGAGIQADLKTFSALGCYGMSVIAALTAQNTRGVSGVYEVPPDFVAAQIDAVFEDIRVDAVKIGMLGAPEIVDVVAAALEKYKPPVVVLDPVMIAQSGDRLTGEETISRMKSRLLKLADILTPNIPEAEILLGDKFDGDLEKFTARLLKLGPKAVLLKGGHAGGENSDDIFVTAKGESLQLPQERIETKNNHGTGCTLASALAAYLAKGRSKAEAAKAAKAYITGALQHADELDVGTGHGPVHHFFAQWD